MVSDRRERPWKKLRVIVEVTVPPNCRAQEKDLAHEIEQQIARTVRLPRPIHANAYEAVVRLKSFTSFWPAFLRKERGLPLGRKKEQKEDDQRHTFPGCNGL